jgi:hypothetical protein
MVNRGSIHMNPLHGDSSTITPGNGIHGRSRLRLPSRWGHFMDSAPRQSGSTMARFTSDMADQNGATREVREMRIIDRMKLEVKQFVIVTLPGFSSVFVPKIRVLNRPSADSCTATKDRQST